MTAPPRVAGFRLGTYVFQNAAIVDFAAPYGVFSVARRFDPEVGACLVADTLRPVQAQAGFTVLSKLLLRGDPAMDAFLAHFSNLNLRNETRPFTFPISKREGTACEPPAPHKEVRKWTRKQEASQFWSLCSHWRSTRARLLQRVWTLGPYTP
jgi:hypothetical protein